MRKKFADDLINSHAMPTKDWDKIMRDIATPPDSDEDDVLNVQTVKKNARRVVDMLHSVTGRDDLAAPPKGMNRHNIIRDGLREAAAAPLRPTERRSGPEAPPQAASESST